MAGATWQQQETLPMDITEADEIISEHKAFLTLQNDLAQQLEHCATYAANYAYAAELIPDATYDKVFDRDMAPKSDVFKVMYLLKSVRNNIKAARSRDDAKRKMSEFLDCLREESVFDELVKSLGEVQSIGCYHSPTFFLYMHGQLHDMVLLTGSFEVCHFCWSLTEEKVAAYEKKQVKDPEFKALKDSDIVTLTVGSVHGLATKVYAKDLLTEDQYHYIISSGNESKLFILALLDFIAGQIQCDPEALETFITEVLDKIGPPVSALGDRLRKSFTLNSCNDIVFICVYLQVATYLHVIFRSCIYLLIPSDSEVIQVYMQHIAFKPDVALALMHTINSHAMCVTLYNSMIVDASQNSCHIVCLCLFHIR